MTKIQVSEQEFKAMSDRELDEFLKAVSVVTAFTTALLCKESNRKEMSGELLNKLVAAVVTISDEAGEKVFNSLIQAAKEEKRKSNRARKTTKRKNKIYH